MKTSICQIDKDLISFAKRNTQYSRLIYGHHDRDYCAKRIVYHVFRNVIRKCKIMGASEKGEVGGCLGGKGGNNIEVRVAGDG